MVDFNPKVPLDPNAQSWVGASRAADPKDYRADKSMETLFSGVGDLVTGATQSAYLAKKESLKGEIDAQVNPVRDAQGVYDAQAGAFVGLSKPGEGLGADGKPVPGSPVGGIPAEATQEFAARLQKMNAAKADGRFGNTYYYGQLEAITRQMKSRNPGFGEEIDAIIRDKVGITPANALRNSLLEQMDGLASKQQKTDAETEKFIKDNVHLMDAPTREKIQKAIAQGRDIKPLYGEVFAQSSEVNAKEAQTKAESARLVLEEKSGQNMAGKAEEVFTRRAVDFRTITMKDTLAALGGPDSLFIQALEGRRPLSGSEAAHIPQMAEGFRQRYSAALNQILDTPMAGTNSNLRTFMGTEKVEKQLKSHMEPINTIIEGMTNASTGISLMNARILASWGKENERRIYEGSDVVRNLKALGDAGVPSPIMQIVLEKSSVALKGLTDVITSALLPRVLLGQMTVGELMVALKKGGATTRPEFFTALDKVTQIISTEGSHPTKVATAKALFATENIVDIFPGEGATVFNRMMTPALAKSMKDLDSTNPGIYNQYRDWVLFNFQFTARQLGNNVGAQMHNKFVTFDWDVNSNQFIPKHTPAAEKFLSDRGIRSPNILKSIAQSNSSAMTTLTAVDNLNKALTVVNPLLAETDFTTTQAMQTLFKEWGINKSKPESPGFFESLYNSITLAAPDGKSGLSPGLEGLFGTTSVVNFPKASGGNEGTGSRRAPGTPPIPPVRPTADNASSEARNNEQPAVPGGLGAALGDNVFSSEATTLSGKIQRSQKAQEILKQEPARVIPGKNTTRSQDGGDPGVSSGESGSDSNENNTDSSGLFAGEGAQTDTGALGLAQMLEKKGSSPSEVRSATDPQDGQRTGWFRGDDNKWKFEITDSEAALDHKAIKSLGSRDEKGRTVTATLQDILKHPTFFEMYPEFKDTKVESLDKAAIDKGVSGSFRNGILRLNPKLGKEKLMSTVLHEVQHSIQDKENFASGGSSLFAKDDIRRNLLKRLGEIIDDPNKSSNSKEVTKLMDEIAGLKGVGDFNAYQRLGGENESRNVEARRTMSIGQLRKFMPSDSSDYKKGDQFNIPSKER